MGSTFSSEARSSLRAAVRGALEGLALAVAGGAALWSLLAPDVRGWAVAGLGAAWTASTASLGVLAWARRRAFRTFLRAFGAGVAVRFAGLAVMVAAVADRPYRAQAAGLATYALGLLVLLLLEYRQLGKGPTE